MKIVYVGLDREKRAAFEELDDVILFLPNRWDDYSYKTSLLTRCRIRGEEVALGGIRMLFEDQDTSFEFLDDLVKKGWDGVFPVPGANYISTPDALSFYEQIDGRLDKKTAVVVAQQLRDASYMTVIKMDANAQRLLDTSGFRHSLQRERGSIKAFLDGWKFLTEEEIFIENLVFNFKTATNITLPFELRFVSENPLPHEINVVIGSNGTGKSQLLRQMVDDWLNVDPSKETDTGFAERPNLNQMVVVSYSPFELFPIDAKEKDSMETNADRQDQGVYRYFGLRGRRNMVAEDQRDTEKVVLSRDFPKANAVQSLIDCLDDDKKFGAIEGWPRKIEIMESVLKSAIDFDDVAVVVPDTETIDDYFDEPPSYVDNRFLNCTLSMEDARPQEEYCIPIASDRMGYLKVAPLRKHALARKGVVFLKDKKPVHLSSGQRLFSYIVINILGAIRRDCLILIDEPELFLHPNLEIAFIGMLKSILSKYRSKALIATHSLVTVREIPSDCVHVFEKTDEGIVVKRPPFETFGGDIQRISSYVFGDRSISKPYEAWIRQKLESHTAEELMEALGSNINEEMMIQIQAMEKRQW